VGSEALSRMPGSWRGPFPLRRGRQDPSAFGRKHPFDFLGFSKHFNFKNDIETLIPPCRPLEVAVGGGSKACLGFSPSPPSPAAVACSSGWAEWGWAAGLAWTVPETWTLLRGSISPHSASGWCHLEESCP